MFPHIVKLPQGGYCFRGASMPNTAPIRNRSSRALVLHSGDQGKRIILVCNLPPRPLMWKGARGVRGTNSSPRSPRLKPDKNVQNVPMDEDPLCSDGPIDIMLKPKPGLVPHFSCTFRPLQEAVLRHSPQGSPQNSPRLHPHSPRSRCDTPLCPSPTRSHSSMIPNAPLLIRPRAYAHRSRSRSWDDTRESRTAEAR